MHCSSCELLIERMALRVDGILAAASSYATSTAKIVYDPDLIDEAELSEIISVAGYRARLRGEAVPEYDERQSLLRLIVGVGLAVVVMMLYLAILLPHSPRPGRIERLQPIGWLAFRLCPGVTRTYNRTRLLCRGTNFPWRVDWAEDRCAEQDNLLIIAILAAYGYSVGPTRRWGRSTFISTWRP